MLFIVLALACRAACEADADCEGDQGCLWTGGGAENRCATLCVDDADCDGGACHGQGASCNVCQDVILYCD